MPESKLHGKLRLMPIKNLRSTFIDRPTHGPTLALFRIAYALVGLFYAVTSVEFVKLRWYDSDIPSQIFLITHYLWIFLLCLMLIGIGGRVRNFLHFLVALFLLDPNITTPLGNSVQETVYLLPAFWISFMNLDEYLALKISRNPFKIRFIFQKIPGPISEWPIFLLGLNYGAIFCSAGIHKLMDPLWQMGLGYYMTSSLPWIAVPGLVAEYSKAKFFYLFINHSTIVLEIALVLLWIFKKTRLLATFLIIAFFAGLVFPLRLDFIGWIGLTYFFAFLSISSYRHFLPKKLRPRPKAVNSEEVLKEPFSFKLGYLVFSINIILMFNYHFLFALDRRPADILAKCAAKNTDPYRDLEKDLEEIAYRESSWYQMGTKIFFDNIFVWLNRAVSDLTTRQGRWHLFTRLHNYGTYEYRVILHLKNGQRIEPVVIFNPDYTGGPYTQGIVPRYAQACMYPLAYAANILSFHPGHQPNPRQTSFANSVTSFAESKLDKKQKEQLIASEILVAAVKRDARGKEPTKTSVSEWKSLFLRDAKTGKIRWFSPARHPLQSRVECLPNFWLSNNPGF